MTKTFFSLFDENQLKFSPSGHSSFYNDQLVCLFVNFKELDRSDYFKLLLNSDKSIKIQTYKKVFFRVL